MIITLKDGSKREVQEGISVIDLAKEISEGLARVATAGRVDGKVVDLRYNLNKDCNVEILTFDDEDGKKAYWHTTSHIMAQAIKRLYKDVKLAIGPAIYGWFYYDFDTEYRFSEADFEKVEAEMKKIIKEDLPIERFELPRSEAIKLMKDAGEDYKVELIEDIYKEEYIKDIIVTDLNSTDDTKKIINNIGKDYDCIKVAEWRECKDVIDSIDEVKK